MDVQNLDGITISKTSEKRRYAFIYRCGDYIKVSLEEIERIEAAGSYSTIYLTNDRKQVVSLNLAAIQRLLPDDDFIRIHRSCIINLEHVESVSGNRLKIGNSSQVIGREFREYFFGQFIFFGTRKKKR